MKATINDRDKLADKIDSEDKSLIKDALKEGESWLSANEDSASKDDFESHLKDIQKVCDPIIAKVYQKFGGQQQQTGDDDETNEDL